MIGDQRLRHLGQCFAGFGFVAAFFALDRTSSTIHVTVIPPWDASAPGELNFWLGAIMFLLPGCALIGLGARRVLAPLLMRVGQRLTQASESERRAVLLAMLVIAWALARIGNQVVLHGQPLTDDEDASRFGGQVLASGSLFSPLPPMRFAFPELFLFQRAGYWTSFDFLGALSPWVFSEWTQTGTFVFSLFAALPVPCVAWAVMRRQGVAFGVAAGLLTLCSPMALTLSITSHAHVISRGLCALGLGLILFIERASVARSFSAGLAFGAAFATRPPELTTLLLPFALGVLYQAAREREQRPRLLGLLLGVLPGLIATFSYNYAVGETLGFLRGAPNEISTPYSAMMHGPFAWGRWDDRFGNNLSYNALMLSIWFLGPVGVPLALLGALSSRTHMLLAAGVSMTLALCMLHDDRGLHIVGPIHMSDTLPPLAILASAGLSRALTALSSLDVEHPSCAAFTYAVLGLLTFSCWHARSLAEQARAREEVYVIAEDVPRRPAIVLAESFSSIRENVTPYGRTGGWVFEWRRARPDLSESVLIVHDSPEARAQVAREFPERTPYVLSPKEFGLAPVPLPR